MTHPKRYEPLGSGYTPDQWLGQQSGEFPDTMPSEVKSTVSVEEVKHAFHRSWIAEHEKKLHATLKSTPLKETPQRIHRARVFDANGDFLVFTLVENFNVPTAPGQQIAQTQAFVIRPYTLASDNGATIIRMDLYGKDAALVELVAFFGLDKIDPADIEWSDETRYSDILVVGDILKHSGRPVN